MSLTPMLFPMQHVGKDQKGETQNPGLPSLTIILPHWLPFTGIQPPPLWHPLLIKPWQLSDADLGLASMF